MNKFYFIHESYYKLKRRLYEYGISKSKHFIYAKLISYSRSNGHIKNQKHKFTEADLESILFKVRNC